MKDIVVIQNLKARGFAFDDISEMLRYEAMETKPRVLDKEPKRLTLRKASETPIFGCKQELIIVYNELLESTNGDLFTLDLNNIQRYCDKEVFVVLQALIRHSMTYVQNIAVACYEVFRVIATADFDTLTKERVYGVLQNLQPTEYYAKQVHEAVRFCLFGENPVVPYWKQKAKFNGLYRNAFNKGCEIVEERCETEKDVDKLLRDAYRDAKADKNFMKETYTDGISKEMVGMLYLLKDVDSAYLDPDK